MPHRARSQLLRDSGRATITFVVVVALLCVLHGAADSGTASAQEVGGVGNAIASAASRFGATGLDESLSDLDGSSHDEQIAYDFLHMWRAKGGASPDVVQEWTAHYNTPSGWPLYICVSRFDSEDAEEAYQIWASRYDDEIREMYAGFQGAMPSGFSSREVGVGDARGTEWSFTVPGGVAEKTLAWQQGPLVVEVNYGEGASSSGFADLLFDELTALDLDSGDVVGPDDAVPTPETPADGLSASVSPSTFTELGDEARISVGLSGADAQGVTVVLSGHGRDLNAVTDAGGSASFTITHDDEAVTEYRFTLIAGEFTREVVIPVIALRIHAEEIPATGEPYAGVVADGRSTLEIDVSLGTDADGSLRVIQPDMGILDGRDLYDDGMVRAADGNTTLTYTPPGYIDSASLTERVAAGEGRGAVSAESGAVRFGDGTPLAARVPITFAYIEDDGRETQFSMDVLVTRAPVMLVHGFTGDRTTWAKLQTFLGNRGFDAVIHEYYAGNQGIHDQAELLGSNIAKELARYERLGLKGSQVDVIGHSMGGLIARDYVYGLPPHPDNVRKVIMVGTPNHGATFLDKVLGNLATEWSGEHSLASEQLYSGSAFLAQLNDGETAGRHLSPDVQYGNIYGVRTDWVVTESSAWLNGVASRRISGVKHSAALSGIPGVPITDSATVFGWVTEWLSTDIRGVPLRDSKAQIVGGNGETYVLSYGADGVQRENVTAFPRTVAPWEDVGTGANGRARIRLSVAGLAWGNIDLAPDTVIALGNITPDSVTVRVRRGSARFRSLKREGGGHFQVVLGETDPGEWMTLHPDAKVIGLDTDFVASSSGSGEAEVLVLGGRARFDGGDTTAEEDMLMLDGHQAGALGVTAGHVSRLAADQWWTHGFYRPSLSEVLEEWWAIVSSRVTAWFDSDADVGSPPVASEAATK